MKETLKLSKPVMVDDKELTELQYDFDEMTARDKLKAGAEAKLNGAGGGVPELDSDYHIFLFAKAVSKAMPHVTTEDILRISAKDSMRAAEASRNFFYGDLEV